MNREMIDKFEKVDNSIEDIRKLLDDGLGVYDKLTVKEKVDFDLFIAYTLNTLYWMYLRINGEDPNQNDVKNELSKIKELMVKAKKAHERTTIRPTINKPVAARFVKHGIKHKENKQPPNKITKFAD